MRGEQSTNGGVVELTPIVSLHGEDRELELGTSVGKKIDENRVDIRFAMQRKRPYIMCIIVEDYKVELVA